MREMRELGKSEACAWDCYFLTPEGEKVCRVFSSKVPVTAEEVGEAALKLLCKSPQYESFDYAIPHQ